MRHPARPHARAVVAATAAALIAACGSTTDPEERPGDYGRSSVRSTGAMAVSDEGIAFYMNGATTVSTGFTLAMGSLTADSSLENFVAISRARTGVPAVGSYELRDVLGGEEVPADAFALLALLGSDGGRQVGCIAHAGTVTVESVGSGRVRGRYRAQATCFDDGGDGEGEPAEATIDGTFDAVDGERIARLPSGARLASRARAARLARARR